MFVCDHCCCSYNVLSQHFRRSPDCIPGHLVHECDDESEDAGTEPWGDAIAADAAADALQEQVAWDLTTLRCKRGFSNADIQELKDMVRRAGAALEPLRARGAAA